MPRAERPDRPRRAQIASERDPEFDLLATNHDRGSRISGIEELAGPRSVPPSEAQRASQRTPPVGSHTGGFERERRSSRWLLPASDDDADWLDEDPTRICLPQARSAAPNSARPPSVPPPLPPSAELREGALIAGRYRVERVVGSMGDCVVVKVRHAELGQRALLKYLSSKACGRPGAVPGFLSAAKKAMELRSEHCARTLDAGRLRFGSPYVVTEAFQGSELREVLRIRGALSPTEAIDFVVQAAAAVAEAHRLGLVHGSLSPSTLFVTRRADGLPVVKVLEFGSSETLRADPLAIELRRWTQGTAAFWESSRLWDTLAYSAPEQLRGVSEPTRLSDIWALGAILHELISGSAAFEAKTTSALLAAIVADPPAPLLAPGRELPASLEGVVRRSLAKEPSARFPTIADFAAALRPFASLEAQLSIDRIVRTLSYDGQETPLAGASRAIVRVHPSDSTPSDAEPSPPSMAGRVAATDPPRKARFQLVGAVLLVGLGIIGGTLAGAFAARYARLRAGAQPEAAARIASQPEPPRAAPASPSPPVVPAADAPVTLGTALTAPIATIPASAAPSAPAPAVTLRAAPLRATAPPAKVTAAPRAAARPASNVLTLFDDIR